MNAIMTLHRYLQNSK